ncbi:hypothetical protein DESA109040_04285 [Deinococcus saxicola]
MARRPVAQNRTDRNRETQGKDCWDSLPFTVRHRAPRHDPHGSPLGRTLCPRQSSSRNGVIRMALNSRTYRKAPYILPYHAVRIFCFSFQSVKVSTLTAIHITIQPAKSHSRRSVIKMAFLWQLLQNCRVTTCPASPSAVSGAPPMLTRTAPAFSARTLTPGGYFRTPPTGGKPSYSTCPSPLVTRTHE